jgi:integrase
MNWYALQSDDFVSPIVRGMAFETQERERILDDDELRAIWKTAETFPGPWGHYVRFLLLTASRRTEASEMERHEVKGDNWTIPAARYKTSHKTKRDVTLPLSKKAKEVLAEVKHIDGCPYVFSTDGKHPISGFTKFKARFDQACGVKDWRLHDLRRTARSLMSRAGVNADIAERCLGHVIPGVRGVYDRHDYQAEMLHAFEKLASLIDNIIDPNPKVVRMRK